MIYLRKQWLALLLALVMAVSMTACATRPEPVPEESQPDEEQPQSSAVWFYNTLPPMEDFLGGYTPEKLTQVVQDKHGINGDTVGWLQIPGTTIDEVVVWYPGDRNEYYLRLDFDKNWSMNGIYYADYRNQFGEGELESLSTNTVIYGHTLNEDPNGAMFGPLLKFLDEDFARQTPYIQFSTMQEDLVWEVFAVSYTSINLPYNRPDLTDEQFDVILSEMRAKSLYEYNIDVTTDDKVLTLSTCTYRLPDGTSLGYPNNYRYVIMAKQVKRINATKEEADFVVNTNRKDP